MILQCTRVLRGPLVVLMLLATAGIAVGQSQQGNVYGTVTGTDGDALPGVTVTVSGIGAEHVRVTDRAGNFRFPGLDPGRYTVEAELEGFSPVTHVNVTVSIGRTTSLSIQMTPAVEEAITVTSESPLLDARKITTGTSVSRVELEKIPTARDPWSIVTQSPGVVTDRINVGGSESGQQAAFLAGGQNDDDNVYAIDGVVITDMAAVASATYYDFDQFEEMQVVSGGSDITTVTAGVTLNLVTKRGSNEPRGSARFFLTDADKMLGLFEQADPDIDDDLAPGQDELLGNSINEVLDYGFEAGGPLVRDRLWLWGAYGRNDVKQLASTGAADDTLLENFTLRFNGQLAANNSAVASYNLGDKLKFGRGASPQRPDETTWNQDGPTEIWKLEDTHVFSSNLYLSGMYSFVDGGFNLIPKGGLDREVVWDEDGVFHNSYAAIQNSRDTTGYRIEGSSFFATGALDHELKFGADYRQFEVESSTVWPGGRDILNWAGELWGFEEPNREVIQIDRSGKSPMSQEYASVWLQDTLTRGQMTVNAGVRYDIQEGRNEPDSVAAHPVFPEILPALDYQGGDAGFDWETVSPRLGVTYAVGEQQRTLLRASYARFAEQLQSGDVSRVNPVGTAYGYLSYEDVDGDLVFEPGVDGEPTLFDFTGFDPTDPGSLSNANLNDPDLSPELTDELILGAEHALRPELVVGVQGVYRQVTDIKEFRTLLDDGSVVTRDDYEIARNPDGSQRFLTGELPDGSSYRVPLFQLREEVAGRRTGGTLLTNGSREREYLGANLNFTKRLANRWMARGYVNWGKAEWKIDDDDLFYFDPTNLAPRGTAGGDDRDGETYVVQSVGGGKNSVYMQSTWSANLNGMVQFGPERPWGFNVAANLFAREGYPLPYFRRETTREGAKVVQVTPKVDTFRTDDVFSVDLRIDKELHFADNLSATLSLDAFNLFNENPALQRELDLASGRANFLDESLSPRIYRLGFRLNWR